MDSGLAFFGRARNDAYKNRVGHISVRHMWADGELSKPSPPSAA
jgi:hypothetical protein